MNTSMQRGAFVKLRAVTAAIREMHAKNVAALAEGPAHATKFAIWLTGGAAHLPGRLHDELNSSATVYAVYDPYDQAASFVAKNPHATESSNVSMEMAIALAATAMGRARDESRAYALNPVHKRDPKHLSPIYGVGITVAVQTSRERGGCDQGFLALVAPNGETLTVHVVFERETWRGKRKAQNLILEVMALNLMLTAMGLPQIPMRYRRMPGKVFCAQMRFLDHRENDAFVIKPAVLPNARHAPPTADDIYALPYVAHDGSRAERLPPEVRHPCFVRTSGNPPTASHFAIVEAVGALGHDAVIGITDDHPTKGRLEPAKLLERVNGFRGQAPVLVRRHGRFANDAAALAEEFERDGRDPTQVVYAVGSDIVGLLVHPDNPYREQDLDALLALGALFLVFPRAIGDERYGRYERLADHLPKMAERHRALFREVDVIAPNVSSTMVRNAIAGPSKPAK